MGTILATLVAATLVATGCATFPDSAPSFTDQPSLTPNEANVVTPTPGAPSSSPASTSGSRPSESTGPSSSTPTTTDPCAPTAPPVIASCLNQPWGLVPLPDGSSALVGERTTGRIFRVAEQQKPVLVATVPGVDGSGDGGLLGIALSPYYTEDELLYAYVTTAKDNRIVRIAPGDKPKAIFTGIPAADEHNGGPIAFGPDGMLYVATGDAGDPSSAGDPDSLAGKVLRLDAFGKPAQGNPGGTAVYASGLQDPTGICPLPGIGTEPGTSIGSGMGTVDHRGTGDLLLPIRQGKNYTHPASGDAVWTYQAGNGGGVDCAISGGALLATSLREKKVISIQLTPTGGFTGSPQDLVTNTYGRLRTIITGPGELVWLTTSNTDGAGEPGPHDDRVIILPAAGGGGGGGQD